MPRKHASSRRPYNPYRYGTKEYFAQRETNLGRRLRGQNLAAGRGSRKAARDARATARTLAETRSTASFAERVTAHETGTRRHIDHILRAYRRMPTAERQKIDELRARYGSRPVPGNVSTGLSQAGWWLFFRAGGATG